MLSERAAEMVRHDGAVFPIRSTGEGLPPAAPVLRRRRRRPAAAAQAKPAEEAPSVDHSLRPEVGRRRPAPAALEAGGGGG